MKFEQLLDGEHDGELWSQYCGFLDLSLQETMRIQNRLMREQMELWNNSGLGRMLLRGRRPTSVDEFRATFPLTTYADYSDVLLSKQQDMLPGKPMVWIQTTWEGGKHPVKLAPYTRSMLDTMKSNMIGILMMSTSKRRGHFDLKPHDRALYGCAPLPYATGLIPLLFDEEIDIDFLPSADVAQRMSFSERNRLGFKMGLKKGIDLFFGLGSVSGAITDGLSRSMAGGGKGGGVSPFSISPAILARLLKARYNHKHYGTPILPKHIFRLKGLICAGTDTECYRRELENAWGMPPLFIAAGTEPTAIGTETWSRNGIVLFPDACFYEFIPEEEMRKNLDDPTYQPQTCLLNEVHAHKTYEIVISVLRGGAFMRYRVGDVYRCLSLGDGECQLPKFEYIDRVPNIIDIAGFTRITAESVADVIRLSGLGIAGWTARKEYSTTNRPYLHLFVEMRDDALEQQAMSQQILHEHLSIYFKYFDSDYHDLKLMLGIDPLKVTILRTGSIERFVNRYGRAPALINPQFMDISNLLKI